jgi:hypothetical protein
MQETGDFVCPQSNFRFTAFQEVRFLLAILADEHKITHFFSTHSGE